MLKLVILAVLSFFVFDVAFAQKDTAFYYLNNTGKEVANKTDASVFLAILPPDTSINKKLFIVKGYHMNGKMSFMGSSITRTMPLKLQGPFIDFYANGNRKKVTTYDKGNMIGNIIEYFPNGLLYTITTIRKDNNWMLERCDDSTGTVLAENGTGTWITYFDHILSKNFMQGPVKLGLKEGEWRGIVHDSLTIIQEFKNGNPISTKTLDKTGKEVQLKIYTSVEQAPEFPGGLDSFMKFLAKHVVFPEAARVNNISGRVIISFVVETDGSLTEVKVFRGIGYGCDEEAMRVIKLSPKWKPGVQNGHAVRVQYSVPIAFTSN